MRAPLSLHLSASMLRAAEGWNALLGFKRRRPWGAGCVAMALCAAMLLAGRTVHGQADIVAGEYYNGADPGQGNGQPIAVASPGPTVQTDFTVLANALQPGFHRVHVRFKDADGQWGFARSEYLQVFPIPSGDEGAPAPDIVAGEYWFNGDPGAGNATVFAVSPGATVQAVFMGAANALPVGFHRLHVRFMDADGHWGFGHSVTFQVVAIPVDPGGDPAADIVAGEYWFDGDPGQGQATAFAVTQGATVQPVFIAEADALQPGFHRLHIRFKDADGRWGFARSEYLQVFPIPSGDEGAPAPDIVAGEYWFNGDPGAGNATAFAVSPGAAVQAVFLAEASLLPIGFHRLHVRFKDADGHWGFANSESFQVVTIPVVSGPAANIIAGEYWFDGDPGQGQATAFAVSPGATVQPVFMAEADALQPGFHRLHIRFKDADGRWGFARSEYLQVFPIPSGDEGAPAPDIVAGEYWFNGDPGSGNATAFAVSPGAAVQAVFMAEAATLPLGEHKLMVRFKDADGHWGFARSETLQVIPSGPVPNDECPNAILIGLNGSGQCQPTTGTTTAATPSGAITCAGQAHSDVWFTVNSGGAEEIGITLTETGAQGLGLEVLDDCSGTVVYCGTGLSHLFSTTPDTGYRLRVFSTLADGGFTICATGTGVDCNGDVGGTAYVDGCGTCVGGNTGVAPYPDVQFTGRIPYDATVNVITPLIFSWQPVEYAVLYDLYLWRADDPTPTTPTFSNVSGINVTHSQALDHGTAYLWKLVAKNDCGSTLESTVFGFTTRFHPDLTVESISVPLSPFSGQQIEISWQVRNIGPNATGNATWNDRVWLSTDAVLDAADTYLGQVQNTLTLAPDEAYTSSLTITLHPTFFGSYYVIVRTDHSNSISETDETNNVLAQAMTVNQTPPPDLEVTSLVGPVNTISGLSYPVQWTVANTGTGPTTATVWRDRVYISGQSIFNLGQAQQLADVYRNGALANGDSYTASANVTIPQGYNGTYYFHVRTDVLDQVYEFTAENNNTSEPFEVQVILQPPPDLTVEVLSATPLTVNNHGTLTVQYRVTNVGAAFPTTSIQDRLFIGDQSTFGSGTMHALSSITGNLTLGNGAHADRQITGTIPGNITGPWFVFISTDHSNNLYEYVFEDNNTAMLPGLSVQHADLAVSSITVPPTALSGQTITVGWAVENIGPGDVLNVSRSDRVYLNQTPSLSGATLLKTVNLSDAHAAGTTKDRSTTVALPQGISGAYHLLVRTDAGQQVFENGSEENNTASMPLTITLAPYPDLVVTGISVPVAPVMAGATVEVSYTVQNQGLAAIFGASWADRVRLSSSPVSITGATVLATNTISEVLAPGASYQRTLSFQMPMLAGALPPTDYYIHVAVDHSDQLYEHTGEDNNTLASTGIAVEAPPPIELEALSAQLNVSGTVYPGGQYTVTWTARNNGTATALWPFGDHRDGIYLSTDESWDPGDQLLHSETLTGNVDAGQSYSRTRSVTIPPGISGTYFLLLVVDRQEVTNDPDRANNVLTVLPGGISIPALSYPDFAITAYSVPSQGDAGQPITVSWTVSNFGDSTALGNNMVDRVYLSTDQVIGNDVSLASVPASLIGPGDSYSRSAQVTLPNNAEGNYYILIKTDATNAEYENGSEENNVAAALLQVIQTPPGDLVVTDVLVPPTAQVGGPVEITYRVENIGTNPVTGWMRDVVFLSTDTVWGTEDAMMTHVNVSIDLAPGAGVWRTVTGLMPGVPTGTYHAIVQTDALNNFNESVETNNRGVSLNTMALSMPMLYLDVPEAFALPNAAGRYYWIDIPVTLTGETMLVTLTTATAGSANELYLSHDATPTRSAHEFASTQPNTLVQEVVVPELASGEYYVLAYGEASGTPAQNVELLATLLPFEVRSVSANTGGNTGNCTVLIEGAKFTPATQFTLVRPGGSITASAVYFINSTRVYATFGLLNASLGIYDMRASIPDMAEATLQDAFTVVQGTPLGGGFGTGGNGSAPGGGSFNCSIESGAVQQALTTLGTHPAFVFENTVVPLTIMWSYEGNVDIPTPSRLVISLSGRPIAFNLTGLQEQRTELLLEFTELNGPPGILRPGATGMFHLISRAGGAGSLQFLILEQ